MRSSTPVFASACMPTVIEMQTWTVLEWDYNDDDDDDDDSDDDDDDDSGDDVNYDLCWWLW